MKNDTKIKKRTRQVLLIICVVIGSLNILWSLQRWQEERLFSSRPFDRDLWIKNHNNFESNNPRGPMVNSLIRDHLRVGMYRKEVSDLLGSPQKGANIPLDEDRYYLYYLGLWSTDQYVEGDYLQFAFDGFGRVACFGRWHYRLTSPLESPCLDD